MNGCIEIHRNLALAVELYLHKFESGQSAITLKVRTDS